MIQTGNCFRFTLETFTKLEIIGKMRGKDFDGDDAVEAGVFSFVDLPHAARANERKDLVGAESRTSL
jgi:hypothetical protein